MQKKEQAFTLIEVVVVVAILAILASAIGQFFISIVNGIAYYREKSTSSALADQYLEYMRNLPYSQIGTVNGNPSGNLPDQPNALNLSFGGSNYQIYYVVNYYDDPADGTILQGTDPAPNDYKQVKLYIKNIATGNTNSFLTNVVPKGLEGMSNGGALFVKVFDAVGQPVPNATIHITNTSITPNINLTRLADDSGNWVEVGLPDSANDYHVEVSKSGYSNDSTYPITTQNPNPTKPDATISNGQVTQVSFSIDRASNLTFNMLNQVCAQTSAGLHVTGNKIIGTSPDVLKFDNSYNSSSQIPLTNIEWDTYNADVVGNYTVRGTSPILPAVVLPGTNQVYNMIIGPKASNSLLVQVFDSTNNNPVEGATVNLQKNGEINVDKITGGSVWNQNDWAGGSGQADFSSENQYFSDDGNVNITGTPSGLRLMKNGNDYISSAELVSSSFDTGTDQTVYTTLLWQPTSQDPATQIKFQVAANNDNATWNFTGPDGTSGSYYDTPGMTINAINNNKQFIRYKVFLSTTDSAKTPVLTSVDINYISGCHTPGQVFYGGLQGGAGYDVSVNMTGYQVYSGTMDISGNKTLKVLLSH